MARKMKDSGLEWIGQIPSDWEITAIKRKFTLFAGATPKSKIPENWDGDIVWITPADYKTNDKYVGQGKRNISELGLSSCSATLIPSNSIIFSKRAPIGSVAMNSVPLCTNQGCISSVPQDGVNAVFYYYVMSIYTEQFELHSAGTTFKEISVNNFGNFKIVFPPFHEQKRIADYLDKKCAEIDSLSSGIQSQISILEDYKKSVITEAVTKGLNPNVEMKDRGIECIGEIPAHWRFMAVKRLTSVLTCGVASTPEYVDEDNGVLFLSAQNIQNNKLDLSIKKYVPISFHKALTKNRKPEKGDILQVRVGATIGKCAIVDIDEEFSVYVSLSHIRVNNNMHNRFLNYIIGTDMFKEMVSVDIDYAGTQGNLNVADLREVKIPVPPIQEQQTIADYLDKKCAEIDAITTKKKEQLDVLEQYKKSMIYEYVTGKKEVIND
jgi:type I restriction enzyme S subunit